MRILNRVKGFLISRTTSPVFKGCGDTLVVLYAKLLLRGVFLFHTFKLLFLAFGKHGCGSIGYAIASLERSSRTQRPLAGILGA